MATQYRLSFAGQPSGLVIAPRVRVSLVREGQPVEPIKIAGSADVFALLRAEAATWDRERFLTLLLTTKHTLIGIDEVSVGSLDATLVHPREVFKSVILSNAAAFVVAHNHPSGDPTPSREDIEITRRLKDAAVILGVRFLDHVVIGRERYVSFVDDGYW